MKLREYGYIIWKLADSKTLESEELGTLAWSLRPLVEDWGDDNQTNEGGCANWLTESYNDWVAAEQNKILQTKEADG